MPLYTWENKKTKEEFTVVRSFEDIEVPPTAEEVGQDTDDAEWSRIMCAPSIKKAPGFGSKGNW